MSYVQKRTWVELGPGPWIPSPVPAVAASSGGGRAASSGGGRGPRQFRRWGPRGFGETAVMVLNDPIPMPPQIDVPSHPLPPVYQPPYLPPYTLPCLAGSGPLQPGQQFCPPAEMPCLMGSGPLQPGQAYCDPLFPEAGAAAAGSVNSLWNSFKPYALPVGLAIGAVWLVGSRGRR